MLIFSSLLFWACVVLLIIGLISPQASLFWYKKERTRKFSSLIYGLSAFALLIFSTIAMAVTGVDGLKEMRTITSVEPAVSPVSNVAQSDYSAPSAPTAHWVEVISMKGNGSKKCKQFHLNGNEARMVYTYIPEFSDMGMIAVYVVDAGREIMKDGGIPEVMSQVAAKNEESALHKSAGDYYLDMNASGSWKVSIEQMQ